jgi:hypothetical protein
VPEYFAFDKQGYDRIRKTTKIVLDGGSLAPGAGNTYAAANQVILAKLTERSSSRKTFYSWEQKRACTTSLTDKLTGTHDAATGVPAIDPTVPEDAESPPDYTDAIVFLARSTYEDTADANKIKPCFLIIRPLPIGDTFVVNLSMVAGSDGDEASAPSWTYDVTTLAGGDPIAEAVSPDRPRAFGSYTVAGKGYAYLDETGEVRLAEAWEEPNTGTC